MTGFDTQWIEVDGHQVMVVHFRPDNPPQSKGEWYDRLAKHAALMARLRGVEA